MTSLPWVCPLLRPQQPTANSRIPQTTDHSTWQWPFPLPLTLEILIWAVTNMRRRDTLYGHLLVGWLLIYLIYTVLSWKERSRPITSRSVEMQRKWICVWEVIAGWKYNIEEKDSMHRLFAAQLVLRRKWLRVKSLDPCSLDVKWTLWTNHWIWWIASEPLASYLFSNSLAMMDQVLIDQAYYIGFLSTIYTMK